MVWLRRMPGFSALWRPLLPVALLVGGQFLLRRAGIDPAALLAGVAAGHPALAVLLFLPVGALLCFVGVPRQVVAFAGGLGFGAALGTAVALLATLLGCAASFLWARLLARNWVRQRLHGRAARLDALFAAMPFAASLMLRLLPVGNNLLLNLVAGVSAVSAAPFLLGSAIGYIPQTLVFALIGAGTHIGHGALLGIGAGLFVASGLIGLWLLRRMRGYGVAA